MASWKMHLKPFNANLRPYWVGFGAFALGLFAARRGSRTGIRPRSSGINATVPGLTVLAENRPQTFYAWRGPSMIVVDAEGAAGNREDTGFFFRQTRYLRRLVLDVCGQTPHLCAVAEIAPNEVEFTYVYPEKKGGGSDQGGEENGIRYRDLDLRLRFRVRANGVVVGLRLCNRWLENVTVDIGWRLEADFADYDEVFGERKQQATIVTEAKDNMVQFRYQHPDLPLATIARATGGGMWRYADGRFSTQLSMARQTEVELALGIQAIDDADVISNEGAILREQRLSDWLRKITIVETDGDTSITAIANRSIHDIGAMALLEGSEDEWLTPGAGIPMYQSLWARDALTTVWQATVFDRGDMADSILTTLARLQGQDNDPWRDEQPGRIIRGRQRSPMARLNMNPMGLYYGDYASPFDFIFTLAQLYSWSGDRRCLQKHVDTARRILDWAKQYGDIDGDGYLEYRTRSPGGPKHQGWRDAHNAIVYADGTQVDTPIATCEVQGYWFAALQIMAVASTVLGRFKDAAAYWKDANELKHRFNRDFWMPDQNCVALGLDPSKRQIAVVTSNAAQTLATGIVEKNKLAALVRRLFEPDIFSGWGIRTISSNNPAYNPLSYHLGNVWPVENATFLFGLKRFGFEQEVHRLARALYDLALIWRGHRVPECVGGYSRMEADYPAAYPQANAPQTWNQSVFPILLQTLLGIVPVGALQLLSVYPVLPEWLPDITLRNLRVGDATVTLRFARDRNGKSSYEVIEKRGTLHVVNQPPIESLTAGIWDRLGALATQKVDAA
jgi:glycogen debranching enzyme